MELPHLWQPASRLDLSGSLAAWFGTELGGELLSAETRLLGHVLPDLFGYHALQMGQVAPVNLLQSSRIRHRLVADVSPQPVEGLSVFRARPEYLPLAADSVDVVVMHHLLDVCANPHAVLREACRVLLPEGHLVIVGFNPWSLWGLWRLFRLPWSSTPWLRRVFSPQRLTDWLSLLDFEVVGVESACFLPPVDNAWMRRRLDWLEALGSRYWSQGGAGYVVLARKRVSCMTPMRLRQPLLQMLRPALVAETRSSDSLKQQDE
ncbi:methyltransferase family protein [Fluviicoccus keumensis]|uniref:Methyltransferase family protein n=1 Tax=Fluviicoccus keumensis TaxID=1435465 RepID=A0A4Q7YKQ4_9GAMM|nr:methyltransferase domain-containing protein [Fluviicoccus keumensis]RZU37095.1 methyltransferase family protein [Fluviicoccus keumensis]